MTEADKEFMRFAIMPTYRHEYLGMLEDLCKNADKRFPGGYDFLRSRITKPISISASLLELFQDKITVCDNVAAYAWANFARNYMEKCRNAPMSPFRLYYTKEHIEALAKSHPDEMVKRGRKWYLNGVEVVRIGLLKVPGKRKSGGV